MRAVHPDGTGVRFRWRPAWRSRALCDRGSRSRRRPKCRATVRIGHPLRADGSAVHSGVRLPPLARSIALVLALLGSLSAPALALEHGYVHEHLAQRHGGDETPPNGGEHHGEQSADHLPNALDAARLLASEQRASSSDHAHGHPRLDAATGARDLIRLPVAHETPLLIPDVVTLHAMLHVVRPRVRVGREHLARPDPERGPPPNPRAPPAR